MMIVYNIIPLFLSQVVYLHPVCQHTRYRKCDTRTAPSAHSRSDRSESWARTIVMNIQKVKEWQHLNTAISAITHVVHDKEFDADISKEYQQGQP